MRPTPRVPNRCPAARVDHAAVCDASAGEQVESCPNSCGEGVIGDVVASLGP
jgi:hypothetical protein